MFPLSSMYLFLSSFVSFSFFLFLGDSLILDGNSLRDFKCKAKYTVCTIYYILYD